MMSHLHRLASFGPAPFSISATSLTDHWGCTIAEAVTRLDQLAADGWLNYWQGYGAFIITRLEIPCD
jgi:hypothetical protein